MITFWIKSQVVFFEVHLIKNIKEGIVLLFNRQMAFILGGPDEGIWLKLVNCSGVVTEK